MADRESLLPLLRERRSIRRFLAKRVEQKKVEAILEAALRSPSSRGRNPWEFIVVDDPDLLEQLGLAKSHGSSFLAGAPLAVVVAADPKKCDVWIEDCSIAAIVIQLTVQSLGLGSCWVQIRQRSHDEDRTAEEFIKTLLGMPDDLVVEAVVGIGYPGDKLPGHPKENLLYHQTHHNRFGAPGDW